MSSASSDIRVVRGVPLRCDPAREPCFTVVDDQTEMIRINDDSEASQREKLSVELNSELQSLEIAAQSLSEFPEAPWELRLGLARQCWDEARHARLASRRLIERGGWKGEFPVINQEWGVVCAVDSLLGRLAIQNRTFEAGSLDSSLELLAWWRRLGDDDTADVLEGIHADEVFHVRLANDWIERMTLDNPRAQLEVAAAMIAVKRRLAMLRSGTESRLKVTVPVNTTDRRAAGFTDDEIAELTRRND